MCGSTDFVFTCSIVVFIFPGDRGCVLPARSFRTISWLLLSGSQPVKDINVKTEDPAIFLQESVDRAFENRVFTVRTSMGSAGLISRSFLVPFMRKDGHYGRGTYQHSDCARARSRCLVACLFYLRAGNTETIAQQRACCTTTRFPRPNVFPVEFPSPQARHLRASGHVYR